MEPNDFPQTNLDFITPCEHRKGYAKPEGAEFEPPKNICMLVTERVGRCHAVRPRICARCRIHGDVDQDYVDELTFGSLNEHMDLAFLSFHKDPDYVRKVFDQAVVYAKGKKDKLEAIALHLKNCVREGRISLEHAKQFAEQHLKSLTAGVQQPMQSVKKQP